MRASSLFVSAGGLRWHVQRLGAGPRVLLLHGTGAATHTWRGLAPLLALQFEVLAPDLPGHGFTEPLPAARCSLPGMAQALAQLLAELQFMPQGVLGHSAGAALMLRLALQQRWAGRELVSLNGALLPFEGAAGLFYAPLARLLSNNPLVPHLAAWPGRNRLAVRRLLAGTGSTIDEQGVACYQRLLGNPGHVAAVLAMMANWDLPTLRSDLPSLQCPLLLVAADGDRAVPARQAVEVMALVPGARRQLLHGLGHLCHEEEPHCVAALLGAAWERLAA
jgi:magnesium chelatase accessory protein